MLSVENNYPRHAEKPTTPEGDAKIQASSLPKHKIVKLPCELSKPRASGVARRRMLTLEFPSFDRTETELMVPASCQRIIIQTRITCRRFFFLLPALLRFG
jgi:hypothetical protein